MKIRLPYKMLCIALILVVSGIFSTFTPVAGSDMEGIGKQDIREKIVRYLKSKKVRTSEDNLRVIADTVYEEAQDYEIDYRLVLAVMKVESNFNQRAVSPKGAVGLLQIKPSLAKHVSRDAGVTIKGAGCLHEPKKNIKIGVNHLSWLMDKFENVKSALHAYNVGPARVRRVASEEEGPDTCFTRKVLKEYRQIKTVLPDPEEG